MNNLNFVVPCCPGLQTPGPTLAVNVPGSQASRMPIVKGSDCAGAEAESATKQASSKAATQSRVIDDPPFGSELADRRKRRPVRLSWISLAPKRLVSRQIAGLHTLKPRQTVPLWLRASQRVRRRWHNRHPCPCVLTARSWVLLGALSAIGGPALNESPLMPPYGYTLSKSEIEAVIAYIRMVPIPLTELPELPMRRSNIWLAVALLLGVASFAAGQALTPAEIKNP